MLNDILMSYCSDGFHLSSLLAVTGIDTAISVGSLSGRWDKRDPFFVNNSLKPDRLGSLTAIII